MDDPISARYIWGPDEMAEALAVHNRHVVRPVVRYFLILFYSLLTLGIPIWLIVDSRSLPEIRRNATIALVVMGFIWAWFIYAIRTKRFLRLNARRVFRSKPGGPGPVEWTIGPDQLSNRTENSSSTILWSLFFKVVEAPAGFLLYQSIMMFNWIPGHAFASAQELRRFADLARAKVPNYVVLGECQFPAKPEPIGLDEL